MALNGPADKGIKCPTCGHQTSMVKNLRPTDDFTAIRRRRLCARCGERATTFERFESVDDRNAVERGAAFQRALESCPATQRRLIETLVHQIAADANRIRAAEAADIAAEVNP